MKKFFVVILILALSVVSVSVFAEGEKEKTISENCSALKDTLIDLQHADSRARVYLGRYYETILNSYIVPLNVRLVENNIYNNELMENQTAFSSKRQEFVDNYISYQKKLEDLVATNCENDSKQFYEKLLDTRLERKVVARDVAQLRLLIVKQIELVKKLKEGIE